MPHSNKTTTLLKIAIAAVGTVITTQSMQAQDPSPPAAPLGNKRSRNNACTSCAGTVRMERRRN